MSVSSKQVDELDQVENWYQASYEEFSNRSQDRTNGAVQQLRTNALEQFQEAGFPTSALEEWKYTSTESIRENPFSLVTDNSTAESIEESDLQSIELPDLDVHRMVLWMGFMPNS